MEPRTRRLDENPPPGNDIAQRPNNIEIDPEHSALVGRRRAMPDGSSVTDDRAIDGHGQARSEIEHSPDAAVEPRSLR